MDSTDTINARDVVTETALTDHFRLSMEEEGVCPDKVALNRWEDAFTENFQFLVRKEVNGEVIEKRAGFAINMDTTAEKFDKLSKEVAMAGRNVARSFDDAMVDTVETCGTTLRFCASEGGWAECARCGAKVNVAGVVGSRNLGVTMEENQWPGESSMPYPMDYEIERFLREADDFSKEVLKLYLFGSLMRECGCEFGRFYEYYGRKL